MNLALSSVFLIVFFALAWLPFGQQAFMVEHWMKVGAYIAPILLFMGFHARRDSKTPLLTDTVIMACFFAAAYLVHQVEEHWVDLLGREYPLYEILNQLIANALGDDKYGVMTPSAIFYVNAGTVWTIAFLGILRAPKHIFPAMAMAGLMLVNGFFHILMALSSMDYNSGLATSIVLFVPLSLGFFYALKRAQMTSSTMIGAAIFWGLLGHVFLFGGLFAANIYGLIPVELYYAGLVAFGALPAFLFRHHGETKGVT